VRQEIIVLLTENIQLKKYTSECEVWGALPAIFIGWGFHNTLQLIHDHKVGEGTEVCGKTV